jgi:uncharacterized protein (TIGR02145 family)
MKSIILLIFLLAVTFRVQAQVSINTTGNPPDSSAMLDLGSTTKGFLIPRMTDTQILAIPNPANGLQVFCTTDEKLYVFQAAANSWKEIAFGLSEIVRPAVLSLGAGNGCFSAVVSGIYVASIPMISYNTVSLQVMVVLPGTWNISTDTINGISFAGNGSFLFPGPQIVTLTANGTPLSADTLTLTAVSPGNAGSCMFQLIVQPVPTCGTPFTDPRDGTSYNTVLIFGQCWMAQNLNLGTMVSTSQEQTDNDLAEKYCYGNSDANCATYGGLYQWAEAVQYFNGARNDTTWNPEPEGPVTGICPVGWHLPTNEEWGMLATYLSGDSVAGGKMKETGTTHWLSPNQGATNASGFTALGGGMRNTNGNSEGLKWSGNFWTSSESVTGNPDIAQYFQLVYYLSRSALNDWGYKGSGYSVRCVKN